MQNLTGNNGEKGAAVVEFALVVPLLLLLVFGIVEFGILIYDKAMITNASREGARAGIVYSEPRLTENQIQDRVRTYLGNHLITFAEPSEENPAIDVRMKVDSGSTTPETEYDPTTVDSGYQLVVDVLYQYDFLLVPAFITGMTGSLPVGAKTTMRVE